MSPPDDTTQGESPGPPTPRIETVSILSPRDNEIHPPSFSVAGTYSQQNPGYCVTVSVGGSSANAAITDGAWSAGFTDFAKGDYTATASAPGSSPDTVSFHVQEEPELVIETVDIIPPPPPPPAPATGATLSGSTVRVQGAHSQSGSPAITVRLFKWSGSKLDLVTTKGALHPASKKFEALFTSQSDGIYVVTAKTNVTGKWAETSKMVVI